MLPVLPPLFEKAIQLSLPAALPGTSFSLLIQINTYNYPKYLDKLSSFLVKRIQLNTIRTNTNCVIVLSSWFPLHKQIRGNFIQLKESYFHFTVTLPI